jgi:hypothetical protein
MPNLAYPESNRFYSLCSCRGDRPVALTPQVKNRAKEFYEKGEDSFIMKRKPSTAIFRTEWSDLQRLIASRVIQENCRMGKAYDFNR